MLLWWSHLTLRKNSNEWNHSDLQCSSMFRQKRNAFLLFSFPGPALQLAFISYFKKIIFLYFCALAIFINQIIPKIQNYCQKRFARRPHYAIAASFYRLMDERGKLPRRQNVSRGQKLHPWISNTFHQNLRGGCVKCMAVVLVGANTAKTYCNTTVD